MVLSDHFQWQNSLTAVQPSAARDIHVTLSQDDLKQIEKKVYQYVNAPNTILLPQDLHWLAIEATRNVNLTLPCYEDYHRKKQP